MTTTTSPGIRDRFDLSPTVLIWLALVLVLVVGGIIVSADGGNLFAQSNAVSYTHLTLPTIYSV